MAKRARHVPTVTAEFLPQSGPGVASSRLAAAQRSRPRSSAPTSWLPTKPGGWGLLIAFIVFGGAVGATAYLAIEEIADSAAVLRMQPAALGPLPAHASAPPAAESVTSDGAATDAELVEAPTTDSAPVVSESLQTTQPSEKPAARRAASENRIAKASARTSPPTHARSGESVAASARPPAAAEASQPATIATASVAPESRATDRWELMSAALAACSRENFLAGVVCTERVRLQYCEGFWGQVPNCRAATRPSGSR